MGVIRFLLALSVIAAHSGGVAGIHFVGGKIAVQTFFIISGFYMALILEKKYRGENSYWLFITNRLLRIYPLYIVVLLLSIAWYTTAFLLGETNIITLYTRYFLPSELLLQGYLLLSQVVIVGLDLVMFFGVLWPGGTIYFSTNYLQTQPPLLYDFLFIPQAWTLSLEILFYLLIPFVIKHRYWMVGIFFCAILLRFGIYSLGIHQEPWTNRFFPTELPFFLLGVFIFKASSYIEKLSVNVRHIGIYYGLFVLFLCFYEKIPYITFGIDIKQILFYGFFTASLPFFFQWTKQHAIDHIFGELSYPMYISHMLLFSLVQFFHIPSFWGLATAGSTIVVSYLLYLYIQVPIDRYRQFRVASIKKYAKK